MVNLVLCLLHKHEDQKAASTLHIHNAKAEEIVTGFPWLAGKPGWWVPNKNERPCLRTRWWAGKMAPWLRALAATAKDPGLVPSTYIKAQNHLELHLQRTGHH